MCYLTLQPGTWADWALVFVGLVGGLVAYLTLNALRRQTEQAAKDTVLLNRAYLQVDNWMISLAFFTDTDGSQSANCEVKFRIFNYSKTAARIDEIELKCKGTTETRAVGRILVANEASWQKYSVKVKEDEVFRLDGKITYRDVFRKVRHRTFAQMIVCNEKDHRTEDVEGVGVNDELEWNED
jgi:hypothetical protein